MLRDIEASTRRMSGMSRWERKGPLWRGLAMIYGIKLPEGVNIKRLKRYRKRVARRDTEAMKRHRDAKRACQASQREPFDLQKMLTMAS